MSLTNGKHPEHRHRDRAYFEQKGDILKRMLLDPSGVHQASLAAAVKASYSHEIAKAKKPHTIGERLVLPCAKMMMTELVIGEAEANKLSQISLSNNTVRRRINELPTNIKYTVVTEMKAAGMFSLQLDESRDVQSC